MKTRIALLGACSFAALLPAGVFAQTAGGAPQATPAPVYGQGAQEQSTAVPDTASSLPQTSGGSPQPTNPAATTQDAAAQSATTGSGQIGDIIVTAQKRSESLQRVPLAVTAVTSDQLARSEIKNLIGVASIVPNLSIGQQLGVARVYLRGIGLENVSSGAEGSIAFHLDNVFISRPIAALASFYDVGQIEVLRGPQGTLYGRNATGGSINITTRDPTQTLSGYADITVGNYGRVDTDGAISGPIVKDRLAVRLAFQTQDRDGFGKNITTGNTIDDLRTRAIRGSLLFTPSDRLTVTTKADYYWQKDHSGGYHFLGTGGFSAPNVPVPLTGLLAGGRLASDVRDIATASDPNSRVEFWGVSNKVAYDLSDTVSLTSITGYRWLQYTATSSLDPTSANLATILQFEHDTQFSQELQLSGNSDRFKWLLGLFYFHEKDQGLLRSGLDLFIIGQPKGFLSQGFYGGGYIKTDALAGFGQASYEVLDGLSLTVGARYSSEKKTDHDEFAFDFNDPYSATNPPAVTTADRSKRFKSFTPKIGLDYQVTPDVLLYGSWSKGFKAGTYNLGVLAPPVSPEKISAFEAGIKSSLFDRHFTANVAGFYYDYKDLQVSKLNGQTIQLENAANATIYGLEVELQARLGPRVQVNANGSWLHARFKDYISADPARPYGGGIVDPNSGAPAFDLAGNSLSQSPDFTFFVGAQYELPTSSGAFTLRGEVSWRDRIYYTPFNVSYVGQGPNAKANAFLNWTAPDERLNASLFVRNVFNRTTYGPSYISTGLVGFPINGYLEDPRTYGLRVGYKF